MSQVCSARCSCAGGIKGAWLRQRLHGRGECYAESPQDRQAPQARHHDGDELIGGKNDRRVSTRSDLRPAQGVVSVETQPETRLGFIAAVLQQTLSRGSYSFLGTPREKWRAQRHRGFRAETCLGGNGPLVSF